MGGNDSRTCPSSGEEDSLRGVVDKKANITRQIKDNITLQNHLIEETDSLIAIAEQLVLAFKSGNTVFLFGNGGSAADAQHIASELTGKFILDRESLPAIALTTNTSNLTAIANDFGYDTVFARQIQGLVKKGDIVIGISTSGESPNVIQGIEEATLRGAVTVAFTGHGRRLKTLVDYSLCIPSNISPRIQEAHITAGHIICYLVEQALYGNEK